MCENYLFSVFFSISCILILLLISKIEKVWYKWVWLRFKIGDIEGFYNLLR